ncbi:hypothetical protein JRQ81_006303, partial [Phrynocephalus forsythii]
SESHSAAVVCRRSGIGWRGSQRDRGCSCASSRQEELASLAFLTRGDPGRSSRSRTPRTPECQPQLPDEGCGGGDNKAGNEEGELAAFCDRVSGCQNRGGGDEKRRGSFRKSGMLWKPMSREIGP